MLDFIVQYDLLRAADHPARRVAWLWPGRIPLGKVTLLIGDPGLGKSLIALDVAARISRAAPWPEERVESQATRVESQNSAAGSPLSTLPSPLPASTLILSAEDDLADTIRPRLDACGADSGRVYLLPSVADLRHDFKAVRESVERMPDCRLIVVDPLNAYVGPTDTHFQTVVRRVLAPLTQLAREKEIAILAVAHLRKSSGAAIYRAAGSIGFVSAARAVWIVARDPNDAGRNLLLPLKSNLTSAACGLAFRILPRPPLDMPAIEWDPAPITTPADELLAPQTRPRPPSPDREAARAWLQEALAAGPRPARDVIAEGESRGFPVRMLRRAFQDVEGHTKKRGLIHGWWWALGPGFETAKGQKLDDLFEGDRKPPLGRVDSSLAGSMAILDRLRRERDEDET
jgi:hypothetical protein